MANLHPASTYKPAVLAHTVSHSLTHLPGMRKFNDLNIGLKLNMAFGILVLLIFLVVGLIFVASREATQNIDLTGEIRAPAALASARAQSSLLKMQASVRGYLILSDLQNIDDYNKAKEVFEINLAQLEALSANWSDPADRQRLNELKSTFEAWSPIPERLFELHDNPQENQPALRLESLEFQPMYNSLLGQLNQLIELQQQQAPSAQNQALLTDLIDLRVTFQAMATNLRAYATSGDLAFKFGYADNLLANSAAWENVQAGAALLTDNQQPLLANIAQARQELLALPLQIFAAVEGERTYEDLYLFQTEAEPRAERMLQLLDKMTMGQQALLQADLKRGRQSLANVQLQTLVGGVLALVLGMGMAFIFKENIAGPIQRLITTAEQIASGALNAQATVESKDEIGRLATTVNIMTGRLRETIASLEKHAQQLETIVEISQRLTSKLEVSKLVHDVVERVEKGFNFYHTAIYLLDETDQTLVVAHDTGSKGDLMSARSRTIPLDTPHSLVAQAARAGEIVMVDDVQVQTRGLPHPRLPGTRSEIAVPIMAEARVVGVLDVQDDQVAGFDEHDAKLMRSLANQVAVALTNANLFEQTQAALADTEKLYHLSQGMISAGNLSELIAVVVEGGNISVINRAVLNVFEYNKAGEIEAMVVEATWYSGWGTPPSAPGTRYLRAANPSINLFFSAEPVIFTDVQQDERTDPTTLEVVRQLNIRAMLVLPLRSQTRQVGVLLLEGEQPYHFSHQEIQPYLSLLGQLTVAVENRRLFEQIQQRALELAKAKEAAETASRAKSEFLAGVSHELRTPLNGILGYAQILSRNGHLSHTQANAVRIIRQSGDHLLTLINDILDLSKIEARKLELYPTDFRLADFLEGIVGMFHIRAEQNPAVTFTFERLTPLPPIIHADEKRLRQILINLLSNAIKFTDQGTVTFRVSRIESPPSPEDRSALVPPAAGLKPGNGASSPRLPLIRLGFEIADTGIGMTPEQLQRIFFPFEQVGDTRRRAEGTGLGLAITRRLVEAMAGTLDVESEFGRGSLFRLELAFPALWTTAERPPTPDRTVTGYQGPRRKVLVVDDEPQNRSLLLNLLNPLGFEVTEAADGPTALSLAKAWQPDVILMDLIMPQMTGFEVIQALRQMTELRSKRMIIIAASASAFEEDKLQSMLVGCDDFLVKPIELKQLLSLLEIHLELDWVYDEAPAEAKDSDQTEALETGPPFVPPPPAELAILLELAKRGEIPRLRRRAAHLAQLGPEFQPFATRLEQLARDYDEDQILKLIEAYL